MKRTLSILVVILLASVVSVAHVMAQGVPYPGMPGGSSAPAEAKQIEGKIKAVDGGVVTLEDGTKLMIPPTVKVQRDALKEGATVKASYEEKGGQKIVTSIEVQ